MDLIYANANLKDIGVLQDYSLDMCYGDEDNTFEVTIQKYNIAMQGEEPITQDFILYIEFTEYGGRVDRIESDTKTGEITLIGRTWHGILNSFVIEPPSGYVYRTFNGTANEVLGEMLDLFSVLGDLFVVEAPLGMTELQVKDFEVRYEPMYDALLRMMEGINGKLKCQFKAGKVRLYITNADSYSSRYAFDPSQMPFKIGKTFNHINHLICLGQGNGVDRAVIHLFTDEQCTIQPYKRIDTPLEDSEYYLDKSQQVITGFDERTAIYDYPNAEIIENYKKLTGKPYDWEAAYHEKYYIKKVEDGEVKYELIPQTFGKRFEQVSGDMPRNWNVSDGYKDYYYYDTTDPDDPKFVKVDSLSTGTTVYKPMTAANGFTQTPKDWDDEYGTYYYYDAEEQKYKSIPAIESEAVDEITSLPNDWATSYGSYEYRVYNGAFYEYHNVPSISLTHYVKTTSQPEDWTTNSGRYYVYISSAPMEQYESVWSNNFLGAIDNVEDWNLWGFTSVSNAMSNGWLQPYQAQGVTYEYPAWHYDTYYVQVTDTYPPDFATVRNTYNGIFKRYTKKTAPPFTNSGVYFYKYSDVTPPWRGDGYYWKLVSENWEQIPAFEEGDYYYQVLDRIKELAEGGIDRLKELNNTDTLDISLELEGGYEVGDVIGATDDVTGETVSRTILRKIIKIKKDIVSIDYQVE